MHMQIGDRAKVEACKSDGICYRWWCATVEVVEGDRVVLFAPVGHRVEDIAGAWTSENAIRTFYWLDNWYSLLEVYTPGGRLVEIFVNINSPP
jgi:protein associated with RNAse G/E